MFLCIWLGLLSSSYTVIVEFCCSFGLWLEALWSSLHLPWWICIGFQARSVLHTNCVMCMIMFKCLRGSAPAYLADYCTSTSLVPGRSALRSAAHGGIVVPSHRTDWGSRTFAVAGPRSWNALPVGLRSSSFGLDTFAKHLKHIYSV